MACDSSQPCIYFYLLNCFSFHCFLFSLLMVKRFYSAIKIWRTTENKWKVTNPIWFKIQNAIWLLFAECVIMSAIKFASTFWNLEKKQATTQKRRNDSIWFMVRFYVSHASYTATISCLFHLIWIDLVHFVLFLNYTTV